MLRQPAGGGPIAPIHRPQGPRKHRPFAGPIPARRQQACQGSGRLRLEYAADMSAAGLYDAGARLGDGLGTLL